MKVLHVMYELKFSGAEIMYVDAAPIFQENGCELIILATAENIGDYASFFSKVGFKVLHMPYTSKENFWKRLKFLKRFTKFLRTEEIDVVHAHRSATYWDMALCAWLAGKKSVYTFHNVFKSKNISHPYYYWLRWSAKNIFGCKFQSISDSVYRNEIKHFRNHTTQVHNWYGNKRFFPALESEKYNVREALNIDHETLVLISVGGCSEIKRHSDIIKALPKIIDKIPNCLYLHLGHGETEEDEKILVKQLNLESFIRFGGNQIDVRKYLIASDIYLMTSRFEGISITTIEALACKIPAVLYDVPGLKDFNQTGENCILIHESPDELAEKVIELHKNKHVKDKLAENGYNYVNSKYNIQYNAIQILKLYNS